jgi:hypothetical protein
MCKVYVLTKTTGDWEDTFTSCECVYLTRSEAFAEKEKRDKLYNSLKLKTEDWWNLLDELYDYEEEHGDLDFNNEAEAVYFLHPELDLEQLTLAEEVYEGLGGIPFFSIDEVPLLGDNIPDNLIQILNGNNN